MNTGSKVKQRDPTRLLTAGVHPLLDPRESPLGCESVGNQAAPVLPIVKQANISRKEVSLFSKSAWKLQQGTYSHPTMEKLRCKLIPFQKTELPTG